MADFKQKVFCESKTLNLTVYRNYYPVMDFEYFSQIGWEPDPDPNKWNIELETVNSNLTVTELQMYIAVCMKSKSKKISNAASRFFNKCLSLVNQGIEE